MTPLRFNTSLVSVLAACSALALTSCKRGNAEEKKGPQQLTVGTENIIIATTGSVTTGPAISGSLTPELEANVRAQVSGSVLSTVAEQGQAVRRGQLLAQLDASALREGYLSAKSGVASAQTSFEIASRDLQRQKTLLSAGAIAQRDLEASQRAYTSAQSQLEAARAQLANASKNLENTRIVAPFAGIVSARKVSAGDVVQPGTELFTVVDPTTMRLDASVAADAVSQVKVGTPVAFTVTGYPGRQFIGHVTRVSPVVDPSTRQVQIIASIPNAERTLVGGVFAEGRLSSTQHEGILIPQSAVDLRGVSPTVARVKGGKVEHVTVALGARDDTNESIEITAGIAVGDTLLTGAALGISPGTPVKVAPPPRDQAMNSPSSSAAGASAGTAVR